MGAKHPSEPGRERGDRLSLVIRSEDLRLLLKFARYAVAPGQEYIEVPFDVNEVIASLERQLWLFDQIGPGADE